KDTQATASGHVTRLSMDCKATVHIGEFSRGGLTRGDPKACDHDWGCKEKYIPCGIVDEDSGELRITLVVPLRPVILLSIRLKRSGKRWLSKTKLRWSCCTSKWIMVRKVVAGARSFCPAWCSLPTVLANRFSCCITRPITANTIRSSVAGGSWSYAGM